MINCVWYNGAFGNWDNGLLAEIFDIRPDVFVQHNTKDNPVFERAIVLINGKPDVNEVKNYLEKIEKAYVFLLSDEDGFFRWQDAVPERHELFTQYYTPLGKSEIKNRILLGAPNRIKEYEINNHLPKKYLWSFIGQVQNPFREQCVEVLKTLPDGFLHIVPQFGGGEGGIEYQEYLDILCQSKYSICPSGSMTADSFRLYESIECRSIPITDIRSPRDTNYFDYWKECCDYASLITVNNWGELNLEMMPYPTLIERKGALANKSSHKNYPEWHNGWWNDYKKELEQKLINIANG